MHGAGPCGGRGRPRVEEDEGADAGHHPDFGEGDLLNKISCVTGKMTMETAGKDQTFGTDRSQRVIIRLLGRDRVLVCLYMGGSDIAVVVMKF